MNLQKNTAITDNNHCDLVITHYDFIYFQVAKKSLNEAFKKAQLGTWVSKPIEQDMFDI